MSLGTSTHDAREPIARFSESVVDINKLPTGHLSPAVWITSAPGYAHENFTATDATAARLRGTIIVNYVVDLQHRSGQIEIYSVDRNGKKSTAVRTVPMSS